MKVLKAAFQAGECRKQIKLSKTQLSSVIVALIMKTIFKVLFHEFTTFPFPWSCSMPCLGETFSLLSIIYVTECKILAHKCQYILSSQRCEMKLFAEKFQIGWKVETFLRSSRNEN